MERCILDSDTFSLFLRHDASATRRVHDYLRIYPRLTFSIMTQYEILRGLKTKRAIKQEATFEIICRRSEILPLATAIVVRASEIYGELKPKGQKIGDSDILIAATALVHSLTVISNNTKHFGRIAGLSQENWHEAV